MKFDIVGQYEAFIVVSTITTGDASACLPRGSGLELITWPDAGAGLHPVMYSFGKHRHVHPRGSRLYEYDYDEALIGLPYVGIRRNGRLEGPFFYMTAVRLNSLAATTVGKALGFPKEMVDITNTDLAYEMSDDSSHIARADMQLCGKKFGPTDANFSLIAPLMDQPVISQPPAGSMILSEFHVKTTTAFMMPATMTVNVSAPMPGLPPGTHRFDSIDKTAIGGAYFSVHAWEMLQPPTIL